MTPEKDSIAVIAEIVLTGIITVSIGAVIGLALVAWIAG